ncbi:MAG: hypothetical protein WCX61_05215 [Candidatus Peribacteraceae bacterium]|jgi:Tfp pilus assembly protein PilF
MSDNLQPSTDVLERLEQAERLKIEGVHKEALTILEQLLIEDPQNVSALEEVADNELSLEHYDRAQNAAKQAVALDEKSYTGYYILGFIESHREHWPKASSYLQKANMLRPNNPEILRCLGWVLFNEGKRTQGIVTLERALNLDSENPLTLCDLGVTHLQVHNFPKAKSLFLRALDLDPQNERARECAQAIERLEKTLAPNQQ